MKRSKVLFENHQWQVTDYGMESVKPAPTYHFNAERLLEERGSGDGEYYDWHVHMAEKSWVDIGAFNEAFAKAIELYAGRYEGVVDQAKLETSLAKHAGRRWEPAMYSFMERD